VSYVVIASDLRPVNQANRLFKFADDKHLLVSNVNMHTCEGKLHGLFEQVGHSKHSRTQPVEVTGTADHISKRSVADARSNPPLPIQGIKRVNNITVLGVVINDRLSADEHVAATITACP
jgi:hypothetical protein